MLINKQFLGSRLKKSYKGFEKSASKILTERIEESSIYDEYDIFLSHSYLDAKEIVNLVDIIEEDYGFSVFVDWQNAELKNRNQVSKATAKKLKEIMNNNCNSLLYAFSQNSSKSIWMPWELGYFDGKKGRVAIIPILEYENSRENYKGVEYLGIYPYTTICNDTYHKSRIWINEAADNYIELSAWLNGRKPYKRSN